MNIKEELKISGFQPVVGWNGTDIGEIFDIWINKHGHQNIHFICSLAYGLGRVQGIRDELTRRRERSMGKMKEAVLLLLSVSTDDELQGMLKDGSVSEAVKVCIREELEDRREASR